MSGNTLHSLTGVYQHHTEKALCVQVDGEDFWFPLTVVKHDSPLNDYSRGEKITFEAPEWLILKHGLEAFIDE